MADEKIPEAALMVLVRETTTKHAEEIVSHPGLKPGACDRRRPIVRHELNG
jgi:hypothetical protein